MVTVKNLKEMFTSILSDELKVIATQGMWIWEWKADVRVMTQVEETLDYEIFIFL